MPLEGEGGGNTLPEPPDLDWSMAAGVPRWKTREEADEALRDALRELRGDGPGRMAVETRLKAAYGRAKEFERDGRSWHAWILRCHAHRVQRRMRPAPPADSRDMQAARDTHSMLDREAGFR